MTEATANKTCRQQKKAKKKPQIFIGGGPDLHMRAVIFIDFFFSILIGSQ